MSSLTLATISEISQIASICGKEVQTLRSGVSAVPCRVAVRAQVTMENDFNPRKGIFAPLVVVIRDIVGKKSFNKFRGKAIALHSQIITEFCNSIGVDSKQRQGLIILAKKNGEKLGFLA